MMHLLYTTTQSAAQTQTLAQSVIEENLAVCVQMLAPVQSVYRWQGAVQHEAEYPLLCKCLPLQLPALQQWLTQHHPYSVPAIITWPASANTAFMAYCQTL